jgi:hypothetical protein
MRVVNFARSEWQYALGCAGVLPTVAVFAVKLPGRAALIAWLLFEWPKICE